MDEQKPRVEVFAPKWKAVVQDEVLEKEDENVVKADDIGEKGNKYLIDLMKARYQTRRGERQLHKFTHHRNEHTHASVFKDRAVMEQGEKIEDQIVSDFVYACRSSWLCYSMHH